MAAVDGRDPATQGARVVLILNVRLCTFSSGLEDIATNSIMYW